MQVHATTYKGVLNLRRRQGLQGEDEAMARIRMHPTNGQALLEARLTVNASQSLLAERLGTQQPWLSLAERGLAYMDAPSADRLAQVLSDLATQRGIPVQWRGEQLLNLWPHAQPQRDGDEGSRSA